MTPLIAYILITITLVFAFISTLFYLWIIINPLFGSVPYVPSSMKTVRHMVEVSRVQPGETVLDIGSGDGRIVIEFAKKGAISHGYEINPLLVLISRWAIKLKGLEGKAFIHYKSLYEANFGEFNIVSSYCLPKTMSDIETRLFEELPLGARVVSNTFKFKQWKSSRKDGNVYLYEKNLDTQFSKGDSGVV